MAKLQCYFSSAAQDVCANTSSVLQDSHSNLVPSSCSSVEPEPLRTRAETQQPWQQQQTPRGKPVPASRLLCRLCSVLQPQ